MVAGRQSFSGPDFSDTAHRRLLARLENRDSECFNGFDRENIVGTRGSEPDALVDRWSPCRVRVDQQAVRRKSRARVGSAGTFGGMPGGARPCLVFFLG